MSRYRQQVFSVSVGHDRTHALALCSGLSIYYPDSLCSFRGHVKDNVHSGLWYLCLHTGKQALRFICCLITYENLLHRTGPRTPTRYLIWRRWKQSWVTLYQYRPISLNEITMSSSIKVHLWRAVRGKCLPRKEFLYFLCTDWPKEGPFLVWYLVSKPFYLECIR